MDQFLSGVDVMLIMYLVFHLVEVHSVSKSAGVSPNHTQEVNRKHFETVVSFSYFRGRDSEKRNAWK